MRGGGGRIITVMVNTEDRGNGGDGEESDQAHGGLGNGSKWQGGTKFRVLCHPEFRDNILPETAVCILDRNFVPHKGMLFIC